MTINFNAGYNAFNKYPAKSRPKPQKTSTPVSSRSAAPVSAPSPAPSEEPKISDKLKKREAAAESLPDGGQISADGVNSQHFTGKPDVIVHTPKPGKPDGLELGGKPIIKIRDKHFTIDPPTRANLIEVLTNNGVSKEAAEKIADQVIKKNTGAYK